MKSLSYLGLGKETGGGVDAKIFRFGFRSRRDFVLNTTELSLVSGLERIGYSADNSSSSAINLVMTGLDFSRPLKNKRMGGESVVLNWHVVYTNYLDTIGLDFSGISLRPGSIGSEWELGMSFSKRAGRLEFGRLKFNRIGLAYRFDAHGEFSGVGIVLRSLFDR